ncbi:MAG: HPF/RaiA family ribosome-associated protein [Gammaproteobacteria bacterium]|nr:HPF/RaiA family ribosome-associated protein [Gammaproteobacteria bacterium]
MQIDIQTHGFVLTQGLRTHVEQRLRFALTRFQNRVARVAVHLSDVNGPRGGVDKHCQLQVRLRGLPDIVVKDTEADLYVAVGRATERAGRTLARYLRRARGGFDKHTERSDDERIE